MKSIINKRHTLFLDNWYSSPALFLQFGQKTNVIGTVRNNKQNMPKNFATNKLKKIDSVKSAEQHVEHYAMLCPR
ncbi:piggyBac transposable element-derived protein 4-like [Vespula squamosa]|uniref:PiggyBac transposable element-derived protein 4-like n=1 Tax=Vespula squamosa TaxID=30214 RepID=A0ABD2C1Z3_VESSQ